MTRSIRPEGEQRPEAEASDAPISSDRARRRVLVWGRVQGVFFRQTACEEAWRRRVTGWVRNTSDGCVEAVFEGDRAAVEAMIDWCHRGPRGARVSRVEVVPEEYRGEFRAFDVRGW